MRFIHRSLGQQVRFASGEAASQLCEAIAELEAVRPLVVVAEDESDLALSLTHQLPNVSYHHDVAMHVPADVVDRARRAAEAAGSDVLVSIGGGSTTGLAKAVALTTALPIIAVPTTYAGSEATNVWGITQDGTKTTGVDDRALPRTVIYDAALTLTLPRPISLASGLNALAHCLDSLWAPRADPLNAATASEGIRMLAGSLPAITDDTDDLDGREKALLGAYLSAAAFASAGSGLHHKICHVLGGMFDLPHAQTHAVVLPHVLALNAPHAPHAERRIAAALDAPSAQAGLAALYQRIDAPKALDDYGMPRDGITAAARAVLQGVPAGNPAPVSVSDITALLEAAWKGSPPR